MTLFAEHVPGRSGAAWIEGVTIREARAEDVPHLARIAAEREGGEPERHRAQFERFLQGVVSPDDGLLLVAVAGGEVAGFGKVARFRHAMDSAPPGSEEEREDAPTHAPPLAPEGWYLAGVVVDPSWRRRGIGHRLTGARLDWIGTRADRAYYFVNVLNAVSIDLHHRFGFVEITREFTFPGSSFVGGEGILFGADLPIPQGNPRYEPPRPKQVARDQDLAPG